MSNKKPIEPTAKILLIDSNAMYRSELTDLLAKNFFEVSEANSFVKALMLLKGPAYFDIVIMGNDIPGYSHAQCIETIKKYRQDISVIISTNKRKLAALQECAAIGGDDFISIPIDSKKTLNVLDRVLESRRMRSAINLDLTKSQEGNYFAGYELKDVLGKGAMGMVYLAEKVERGELSQYAMKILNPMEKHNENQVKEVIERFVREAETAMGLKHPNIVDIIECGLSEGEDPQPYIVMELVEGQSLRPYINGTLVINLLEKVRIIRQVAEALKVIHSSKICHRDVKPENIMVGDDLKVKVTDFGFARLPNSELTQTLKVVGTPFYMAPESYTSSKVDARADIFSMGVVAYELFLGQKPFTANSFSELRSLIQTAKPVGPRKIDPSLPIELQNFSAKCLKKDPKFRYNSVAEAITELDNYLNTISKPAETTIIDLNVGNFIKSTDDMVAEINEQYRFDQDWS